jgi:hypothetical protein
MTYCHIFEPKMGTIMPYVIWFECLKILTQKVMQFVSLSGKVNGNV